MESKNGFKSEQPIEKKPSYSKEIWIIDDEKDTVGSILRSWQMKTENFGYNFRHFETAQSAIEEIKKRKELNAKLPDLLFVDGELKKDQGELSKGANFIKQIRSEENIQQPKIIAHSADFNNNMEMLAAGADLGIQKQDVAKSAEFLTKLESHQKEENKQ